MLQESVQRSVSNLVEANYLVKEKEYTLGEKAIALTDKGIIGAFVLGISTEDIMAYFKKMKSKYPSAMEQILYFEKFKELFRIPEKRDFIAKKIAEYCLHKNLFIEGNVKQLTRNELKMLLTYVSIEYNDAFGDAVTLNEFVNKYSIDKEFLRESFQREKKRIDSILKELSQ